MQKTLIIEYKGEKVVSQPFSFKHACVIDDERYKGNGFATGARKALQKMFEGTVITDEIIDNEIDMKILRGHINKIIDWFLGVDEEVKNS